MRAPFAPPRFVGAAKRGRGRPGGRDQLGHGQSRGKNLRFETRDILVPDQLVVNFRDGVLPQQRLRRHKRPEIPAAGAHVAVDELVPRPGEGVLKVRRAFEESLGNRRVKLGPSSVRGPS